MAFHLPAGQAIKEHANPAWTIVLPRAWQVTWDAGHRPASRVAGVIYPPQVAHRISGPVGHSSVFIDPWYVGLGSGHHRAIPLDLPVVEHVRDLWSPADECDPDQRARETVQFLRRQAVLPQAVSIDPRVVAAMRYLVAADCIEHVAGAVGLSPSRLRALIHDQTGTPPARLRMWQRLRAAILSLPATPIALAAFDAGFADQAHLTRTATRFVGLTPGELVQVLSKALDGYPDERPSRLVTAA